VKRLRYENGALDGVDERIISFLSNNSRISVAEIARALDLSPPTVSERIKRLEEAGVIATYSITLNYEALGVPITAWLRVRPIPGELKRVVGIIQSVPQIVLCDRITGEDCFIARAHVSTHTELEAVIDQLIPYSMTNTSIVQSSPVKPRLLRLESDTSN
jgi:Lrp/AsnC family leucine-responsive transcriptional regulator